MNKLQNKFEEIIGEASDHFNYDQPNTRFVNMAVEECKKVAIEFVIQLLLDSEFTESYGIFGEKTYNPEEFKLLAGLLNLKGNEIFENFIENKYE